MISPGAQSKAAWLAAASVLVCLTLGCGRSRVPSSSATLDAEADQYLRLAVALGERDPDSLDYYYGPPGLVADIRKQPPSLAEIGRSAKILAQRVNSRISQSGIQAARQQYMVRQLLSIAGRVDVLTGEPMSFDHETEAVFGVKVPSAYDRGEMARARKELDRLLPGRGNLAARYAAYDAKFMVPRDKVRLVFDTAIAGCRAATTAHVKLPPGEAIEVEYVRDRPWGAYSFYKGNYRSVVQVNMDFGLTVDRALQLACHETYPGHHAYNSLQEEKLVRGSAMKEFAAQPTYSPQSMTSEAAATLAVNVAFPAEERLRFERDALFPQAGLKSREAAHYLKVEALVEELHPAEAAIARDYLDGRLEFERANEALDKEALMTHGEVALKYINEYRSYVATYTYGRDLAASYLNEPAFDGKHKISWTRYSRWMTGPPVAMDAAGSGNPVDRNSVEFRTSVGLNADGPQAAKREHPVL